MADFDSGNINVGNLFSGDSFFKIPNYQRPFSWDFDHFDDLVNDTRLADRNANYFLGTVVFHKDENTKVVVDGQQRLTSLVILLACIRDSIDSQKHKTELQERIVQQERVLDGIPQRERIEVKDREIFNQVVVTEGGTKALPDRRGLSAPQERYLDACTAFHQALDKMTEDEKLAYVTFLNRKCVLIYLLAGTFEEAFRLFEIVNDRGKQLRRIDVLKALTISPDHIPLDSVRDKIAAKWEEQEASVGEDIFESVFFLLRLIVVKDKPQGDLLNEFKARVFDRGLLRQGEAFAEVIFEYVTLYRQIFLERTYLEGSPDDNKFQSLIYIMDSEFRASEWRACVLFFAKKLGRDHLYRFCLAIEKLFLTHWVSGIRKDERYADYTKILTLIENSSKPDIVIGEVGGDVETIKAAVRVQNLYGAGYVKYILLRLELSSTEFESPRLYSARSIEHVHPQKPLEGGAWFAQATPEERAGFVNKCGNLVLLSKGKNSSAGNLEFDQKKGRYLATRVSDYPRSVQVLGFEEWTPELIEQRTEEAANLVVADP